MYKGKILLVEDDKLQAKVTKDYLESIGYNVIWAENGKSALKIGKTQTIDIILLDLVLPDISGFELCRWFKLNQDTKSIPIIMLTVKDSMMEKVEGLQAGADDYLAKPFNEIELNARIYASLRTKSLQDELKEKNRQLEEILSKVELLAITDPLTGIPNRRHFEMIIEKEFNRTVRYKTPTSCIMIDIDHFKSVNDQYGHGVGDFVLTEVANLIKNCIRKVDTIARWGGEEFVILLPGTNIDKAYKTASRIKETISKFQFSNIQKTVTVSLGIASIPEPSIDSSEKLIDAADNALYEAKAKGRNRIEIFKNNINT